MTPKRQVPQLSQAEALARLRASHAAVKAAEEDRVLSVAACRKADPPATWEQISVVVEQKQPNAIRKYRPLIVETTTTRVTVRKAPRA